MSGLHIEIEDPKNSSNHTIMCPEYLKRVVFEALQKDNEIWPEDFFSKGSTITISLGKPGVEASITF